MKLFGFEIKKSSQEEVYSKDEIMFLFRRILDHTVDRDLLLECMDLEVKPIIGDQYYNHVLSFLNKRDEKHDDKEMKKWMAILEEIHKAIEK